MLILSLPISMELSVWHGGDEQSVSRTIYGGEYNDYYTNVTCSARTMMEWHREVY